ncbi:hypothetical protein MJO28_009697 [Puccinia striiformis f. sp. tritici]|uniref:Uncharacterized protein n=1 Tax=Puccinia striiformis f. sp. tritici TaxID=168172 RepID=A0ACC0E7Z8_9BASI|nr:hypothetical protein MJO28_009697 [Puccinia striiformis f. sp. tritici]
MASTSMCWLHLEEGVSSDKCRTARDLVLKMAVKAQATPGRELNDSTFPKDTRTILKRSLNIKLELLTCCPSCYTSYHPPNLPSECSFRPSPKSKVCGVQLFYHKKMFVGGSHQGKFRPQAFRLRPGQFSSVGTPTCTFVFQKIPNWLPWFLSLSGIESAIEDWSEEVQNLPTDVTTDIQQGAVGNKLAGKQQSVGIILMNCMNLPPTMRNQLKYTFLAGVTPGPLAPTMTSIPSTIATHKHPGGRTVQVQLLPLIGDLGATHKVAGFASHSATKFCSWCDITHDEISNLKLGRPRSGAKVRKVSDNWMKTTTTSSRQLIVTQTGIRYSELNRLGYCDPVKHVSLSMMHNWMEGVLMHHFREHWGFQTLSMKEKRRRGGDRGPSAKRPRLDLTQAETQLDEEEPSDTDDGDDFELNQGASGGLIENIKVNSNRWWIMENITSLIQCTHIHNSFAGKLEGSMLKRMCQIQRLEVKEDYDEFLSADLPQGTGCGRPVMLDNVLYNRLLNYTRRFDATIRDYWQFPHPVDAIILRPKVLVHATWDCNQKTRVSVLQPNNCVVMKQNDLVSYGLVREIFGYTQRGHGSRVVCVVEKSTTYIVKPTRQFRFWLYTMKAVVGCIKKNELELVPVEAIDNLAAYQCLPDGIFGLESGIILTPVNRLASLENNPV